MSALSEVMVVLRYAALRSRLHRLVSLFKVREGPFDPGIHTFTISDAGIAVGGLFAGADAVLDGLAPAPASDAPGRSG